MAGAINDPENCYSDVFIGALVPLEPIVIDRIDFGFRKRFLKEFKPQHWRRLIKAAQAARISEEQRDGGWSYGANGARLANLHNARIMLGQLPLAYNAFTERTFLTGPVPWGEEGDWTDHNDSMAADWCQHQGMNIEIRTARAAAESIARQRKPHYHPVTEYLSSLEWDGKKRCDMWLQSCLGVADTELVRQFGAKWLMAAVKRVFEPGCQSDYTLVLEGPEGEHKSTALAILAGDAAWFTDDIGDIRDSKGVGERLQGKWIVELAELDAFRRAEMTTVKAELTRKVSHFRPAFGYRAADFKRQNVFAATTNKDDWGNDDTGLRRFWPVRTGKIDIDKLAAHRDNLWAEAVHRYRSGELIYLSRDMEAEARAEQSVRQASDDWKERVLEWAEAPRFYAKSDVYREPLRSRPGRVMVPEVLEHCLNIPAERWTLVASKRVTRILKLNKYDCKREKTGDRPEYWQLRTEQ